MKGSIIHFTSNISHLIFLKRFFYVFMDRFKYLNFKNFYLIVLSQILLRFIFYPLCIDLHKFYHWDSFVLWLQMGLDNLGHTCPETRKGRSEYLFSHFFLSLSHSLSNSFFSFVLSTSPSMDRSPNEHCSFCRLLFQGFIFHWILAIPSFSGMGILQMLVIAN